MKTKPETEFVFVRPKKHDPNGEPGKTTMFSILRNDDKLDLSDFKFLRITDTESKMEEWVHKDDYEFWRNIKEKI